MSKIWIALAASALLSGTATAAITATPQAAFQPSDTTITFNDVPHEAAVASAYSSSGVTFSGALVGMTGFDANGFPDSGNKVASNWRYSQGSNTGLSFTADFATSANRLGFYLENWPNQTFSVQLFNGAASLGAYTFAATSSLTPEFRGITSDTGFNRAVFTNTANTNGFYAIDNFIFGQAVNGVPEPGTWAMLLLGFGVIGVSIRRRRQMDPITEMA